MYNSNQQYKLRSMSADSSSSVYEKISNIKCDCREESNGCYIVTTKPLLLIISDMLWNPC